MNAQSGTQFDSDADLHVETATIMFADVVESTRQIFTDEVVASRRLRDLIDEVIVRCVDRYGGRLIERRGDGILAFFDEPVSAAQCSVSIHSLANQHADRSAEPFAFRIGLHRSKTLSSRELYFGAGLVLASRVASLALPTQTLVTVEVRDQIVGIHGLLLRDTGHCYIKGVETPLRVFELIQRTAESTRQPLAKASERTEIVLAVLPLQSLALTRAENHDEQRSVGNVYADVVLQAISRSAGIKLISRLSAVAAAASISRGVDPAKAIQADYILSGTWRDLGDELFDFHVELMNISDHQIVWHQSQHVSSHELMSINSQYVTTLVSQVVHAMTAHSIGDVHSVPLPTVATHALVLASVSLMHRLSREDFDSAYRLMEGAVERAPRHAVPRAWTARWHTFRIVQGWSDSYERDRDQAIRYSEVALELDPDISLTHAVAGSVAMSVKRDLSSALTHYDHALGINPSDSLAWALKAAGHALDDDGKAALSAAKQALQLSPLDPMRFLHESLAASACLTLHDFEGARRWAESSIAANRAHLSTLRVAAIACELGGDHPSACKYVAEIRREHPNYTLKLFLAGGPKTSASANRTLFANALRSAGLPN